MLPQEVFKRRHFGTPASFTIITTNFIVLAVALQTCVSCKPINWFFWVIAAGLAAYNIYHLRREREQYNRAHVIAYSISVVVMVLLFLLVYARAPLCVTV